MATLDNALASLGRTTPWLPVFLNGLILRPLNVPRAEGLYLIERASDKS